MKGRTTLAKKKAIRAAVQREIDAAEGLLDRGEPEKAFHHLERAHVLGQADTRDHTRVHVRMLKVGALLRDGREVAGQLLRIAGAASKTPLGIYPKGNTGGANVSPFQRMEIPEDLKRILESDEDRTG